METTGGSVCGFCKMPSSRSSGYTGDDVAKAIFSPFQGRYSDNVGAVPGENMYTIYDKDKVEFLKLLDYLEFALDALFEDAPPKSMGEQAWKAATGVLGVTRERVTNYFVKPHQAPLIVVDGAIEDGGPEASMFIGILKVIHPKHHIIQRKYVESQDSDKAMKEATNFALRMFAFIANLMRHGVISTEGYQQWREKRY